MTDVNVGDVASAWCTAQLPEVRMALDLYGLAAILVGKSRDDGAVLVDYPLLIQRKASLSTNKIVNAYAYRVRATWKTHQTERQSCQLKESRFTLFAMQMGSVQR